MKYAIVAAGGKQYRAEEGKTITVDLLPAQVGDAVNLDEVLLVVDGDEVECSHNKKGACLKTTVEQIKGGKSWFSNTNLRSHIADTSVTK